jgi:hypothetical protein
MLIHCQWDKNQITKNKLDLICSLLFILNLSEVCKKFDSETIK